MLTPLLRLRGRHALDARHCRHNAEALPGQPAIGACLIDVKGYGSCIG